MPDEFLEELPERFSRLEERVSRLEEGFEGIWGSFIFVGTQKARQCKRNEEGFCMAWEFKEEISSLETKQLGGRFYPKVHPAWCALCPHFEKKEET